MTRLAAALAIVQALLCLARLVGWWPCSETCAGGGYYRTLAGVDVVVLALIADLALAGLILARPYRPESRWAAAFLAGVGLWFTGIALALGIHCPFCLLHHGLALAIAVLLLRIPWWTSLAAAGLGGLIANAAFHHAPVIDVAPPPVAVPAQVAPPDQTASATPAPRWRGPASASTSVEVVLDPSCPHCTAVWPGLRQQLDASGARWRVLVPVRPSQPASGALAAGAQAAAAAGNLEAFWASALGVKAGASTAEILRLRPELAPWLAEPAPAVAAQVAADQARLKTLRFTGKTPLVVALRDGAALGRWEGDLDLPAIAATLRP